MNREVNGLMFVIVLGVLAAWLLIAVVIAVVMGRAVRLADHRHRAAVARGLSSANAVHRVDVPV